MRWVGRDLAALLMADGYLDRPDIVADDYLIALDRIVAVGRAVAPGQGTGSWHRAGRSRRARPGPPAVDRRSDGR